MTSTPGSSRRGASDSRMLVTGAAAGADAISCLGPGHAFTADITGNTVLLGIGLATSGFAGAPAA
jgi:uncharacterized membrane protein YoaK (UPF0700 family)